jgi:hypothetical protein
MLNLITNKSFTQTNDTYVKIENFVEVESKEFVNTLKQLTNLGLNE